MFELVECGGGCKEQVQIKDHISHELRMSLITKSVIFNM
jgi:hypothetical protein